MTTTEDFGFGFAFTTKSYITNHIACFHFSLRSPKLKDTTFQKSSYSILLIGMWKPRHPWSQHPWKLWEDCNDYIWGRFSSRYSKLCNCCGAKGSAKAGISSSEHAATGAGLHHQNCFTIRKQLLCALNFSRKGREDMCLWALISSIHITESESKMRFFYCSSTMYKSFYVG